MTTPEGYLTPGDPTDYKTSYTYNDAGQLHTRVTRVSPTVSITETFTYDSRGSMLTSTDGNNNITTYTYDLLNRRKTQTLPDPDGVGALPAPHTTYIYDAADNLTQTTIDTPTTDPRSVIAAYDKKHQVTKTTNPDGTYTTTMYDPAGNVAATTDGLGRVTRYVYDARNRLIATVRPDGSIVRTQYDGGGRVVGVTDALGNTTTYQYDKLGRKTKEIQPHPILATVDDGDATGFLALPSGAWSVDTSHGGVGGDCRAASGTSNYATWTFSNLNADTEYEIFVTWVPFSNAATSAPYAVFDGTIGGTLLTTVYVNQQHDPGRDPDMGVGWFRLGTFRVTTGTLTVKLSGVAGGYYVIADAARLTVGRSTTSYGYDTRGNVQYVTNTSLGAALGDADHTIEYEYNNLGRMTKQKLPDPDGAGGSLPRPTTQNDCDANGNVTTVTNPRSYVTTYQYDEANRKTRQILPDPDGNGELGTLTTRYFYDNDGNLRYVVDPRGSDDKEAAYTTEYDYDHLGRKITAIAPDPDGDEPLNRPTTQYVYDANGNLEHTVDPLVRTTWHQYDKLGRQTKLTDALGSGSGDPAHTTTAWYDAVGNVLLVTDALGRITATQYDAMNRPVLVQQPRSDGSSSGTAPTTTYQYDASGQLVATTDPLGHTTWYQYDALHRQIGVTDASGWRSGDPQHTTVTQYNALGNVVAVTDPLGQVTSYQVDNLGRKTAVLQPDPGTGRPTTYYGYDASGNLKYVTDPRGSQAGNTTYTTWYFYDGLNRQVCTIDPVGADWALSGIPDTAPSYSAGDHSVRTTYDEVGNVIKVADPLGQVTNYGYDYLGRKTSWTQPYPDGAFPLVRPQTTYAYDADGNLSSTTDPLSHVTRYGYDALNRRTQVTDALGSSLGDANHTTTTVYDAVGNVLSVQDPDHNTTSYAYDRLNRVVTQTDPLGQNTTYVYDAAGNLTKKTDRSGRVTEYSYDPLGRQVEERWRPDATSAVFHTIHTYYDAGGQVRGIKETDTVSAAAGTLYQYTYDADGRVTSSRMAPGDLAQSASPVVNNGQLGDELNGEQLLDWDSDGVNERADAWTFSLTAGVPVLLNLSSTAFDATLIVQRPGGNSSTWLIDGNGGGGTNASLLFTPDATGTWTVFVTSPASTTGAYTLERTANANPIVPTALVEFDYTSYDKAGNLLTATENQSASAATGLGATRTDDYDVLNRLTQTKQGVGETVNKRANFAYRDDGSLSGVTRYSNDGTNPIGPTDTFIYDGMGRLKGFTHRPSVSPAIGYAWTFDAASRVSQMTTPDGTTNSISYDATDQVTGVDYTYQTDEGYTYDNNGNRTNTGYSTGTGNRLTADGTYKYTYDGEGNRTFRFVSSDGVLNSGDTDITAYAWDHHNRLTSVSHYTTYANYQTGTSDLMVQYTYDYLDRRILRKIDADGSGAGQPDYYYNVYQGNNPALEIHDSNGLATSGSGETAPHRQHRYLYGQAVDEVLASEDTAAAGNSTGTVLWGLGDHEGTIRDIMNSSGTVVDHRKFDSFGKMTSESAPATDFLFGYTGQALDKATGLYDYHHRWYDPAVGRFASEDPTGFDGGDANLYRYVGNSPLAKTDPTGLDTYGGSGGVVRALGSAFGSALGNMVSDSWSAIRPAIVPPSSRRRSPALSGAWAWATTSLPCSHPRRGPLLPRPRHGSLICPMCTRLPMARERSCLPAQCACAPAV